MRSFIIGSFVFGAASAACAGGARDAARPDSSAAGQAGQNAAVDPQHALDVSQYLTADSLAAHGSCLPTDQPPARSRIIYEILAGQGSYLRLNVVTSSDGTAPVLVDFVRGLSGGRIWSAVLSRGSSSLVLSAFASANDRAPQMRTLSPDSPEASRLRDLATAAMRLPCS